MAKIRLGVIGAGGIVCRLHLPALVAGEDFEVAVLGGRREHRLTAPVRSVQHPALDAGLRCDHRR